MKQDSPDHRTMKVSRSTPSGYSSPYTRSSEMDLMSVLGETGIFQRMMLAYGMLSMMLLAISDLWPLVVAPPVDHWCAPPDDRGNISTEEWKNTSIPVQEDGTYSKCEMYLEQDTLLPNRTTVHCTKWQYDESEHNGTITQEWDVVCDWEWLRSAAIAIIMAAALLGIALSGFLSDSIGRKPVVCFSSAATVLFSVGTLNSKSFALYISLRSCATASVSAIVLAAYTLVIELIPPASRGLYGVLLFSGYVTGVGVVSLAKELYCSWKTFEVWFLVQTCFLLSSFVFVEESPRWLISRWELQRAQETVLLIARMNGRNAEDARQAWLTHKTLLKQEEKKICDMLDVPFAKVLLQYQLLHGNVILCYAWCATSFTFYGMNIWARDQKQFNWALNLITILPPQYVCYLGIEHFGRRPTLCYSLLITSVAVAVSGYLSTKCDVEPLRLFKYVPDMLRLSTIGISQSVVLLYMVETNPTLVRTISACICFLFCRIGGILAVVIEFLAFITSNVLPTSLYAVTCFIAGLVVCLLPETRMVGLPEAVKRDDIFRIEPLRVVRLRKSLLQPEDVTLSQSRSQSFVESYLHERSLRDPRFVTSNTMEMSYVRDTHSAL
ncbi:solute carrier family 22 member 6-like [Ornithodoros turicata]|uniref:solute carrier family 22 member 6-like n=1 Tax=Ornithodoros turicata TaxID=34597 RepID=UPI00313A2F7C